jgi:site-specific recombinase XerD
VWQALAPATRRKRERIFRHVLETAGNKPFIRINTAVINDGLDRRATTPAQARNFLDAMRGIFWWAVKNNHVKIDPTAGIDNPQRKSSDGFPTWTEEHVETYQRHWPLGTRQRVWLDVLLYTGLRRGDAVRLGKQHVRAGEIKTEKTGKEVPLMILPVCACPSGSTRLLEYVAERLLCQRLTAFPYDESQVTNRTRRESLTQITPKPIPDTLQGGRFRALRECAPCVARKSG